MRVGYRLQGAFQRIEMNVLINTLQLAERAFTADRNFRAIGQLHKDGTAVVRFGADAK
jgi:hypothetical protein